MANIGRGGYDPTGANARILARLKRKKKKGTLTESEAPMLVNAPMAPSTTKPQAPKPQEPRIPGQPQGDIGHTPGAQDPKIVSANVKNLTQAYYAKWHRFPTSQQTYAMLQGTNSLWTVNQWWDMFKPLKNRKEKPAIADYEKMVLAKPRGPKSAGIDVDIEFEGQGPLGFYTNSDILDDAPSLFGKSWAWAEGDSAAGNHKTPKPDFVQLPTALRVLDKEVRVGLNGMSQAEQDYYKLSSSGIVAYKQYLAAIKKKNGEKVNFDPNSTGWSKELDRDYHKYLFSRVAPYAILSKDVETQEKANKLIRTLYPKIFGEEGYDLTGVSTEKSVMGLVNIGSVLKNGGVPDRNILEFCYNNFVDGRVPGQSEKKAMYDYVSEFGSQYLPANKFKEYNDSVYTIGKAISKPFEMLTEGAEWMGEATDWLFDEWKDNPGAWGHVGEGIHFLYNGAFTETNPFTSKIQANVFTFGTTALTAGIDMLMDLSPGKAQKKDLEAAYTQWESQGRMLNVLKQKTEGKEGKAAVQAQIDEWKAREPDNPEWFDKERSMKDLLSWKAWTEQYNENLGKMPYGTVFNEIETELGYAGWNWLDQDRWASKALDYVYLAADMYVICKAGAKGDVFAKSAAIKGALKGFSGLRRLEKFAKPSRVANALEDAKIDFGVEPTNPNAAKPARQKYPAGTVVDGVKVGGRWMPQEKGPAPRQHHIPFDRNPELGGEVGPTHGRLGGGRVGRATFRGGKDMGAMRDDSFMNWATYDEGYAQVYGEAGDRTAGIGRYRVNPAAKVYKYLGADEANGFPDLMELANEYKAQGAGHKSIVLAKKVLAAMAKEKGFDVVEIFDYKPKLWKGNENEIMILNTKAVRATGTRGIWDKFGPETTAGERIGQGEFPGPKTEYGKWDSTEPHRAGRTPDTFPEEWTGKKVIGPWSGDSYTIAEQKSRPMFDSASRRIDMAGETEQAAQDILRMAVEAEKSGDPLFKGISKEIDSFDEYEMGQYGPDMSNAEGLARNILDAIDEERRPGETTTTLGDMEYAGERIDETAAGIPQKLVELMDEKGISPRVRGMITRALTGRWGPEDEAGMREMLRTSDEYDMNEVRGRHTNEPVEPEVGQLMAFFRGERRYIADKISEAKLRGETGDHIRIWEEEIAVIDSQWKTLAHLKGGGLNAMIGRMLEIDAEVTRLAAKGDKDSIAQIDELLAEKHELASDAKTMDDVVTLGGEWSAAQYGDTVGGHRVPYKHDDLNRKAPRKRGEGAQELGQQADLTRPPSTPRAGKRRDYDHLKNPRHLEDMTVDEWNRVFELGEEIDGHTALDLVSGDHDGVVLKDGTITWKKDGPEFTQAQIDVAAGRPVRSRAKKNAEAEAARPKPKVAREETAAEYNARIEAEAAKAAETPVEKVEIPKESTGLGTLEGDLAAAEGTGTTKGVEPPKTPPKRPSTKPAPDPDDLRPDDPQYVHSKLLLTVAEYIAQFTKPGDYSDPIIARLLGLIDQPEVNATLIADLQKSDNSAQVLRKLQNAYDQHLIEVDPAGPAIFKLAKAQAREKFIDMAMKMGPLGNPLIEAYRIIGTTTQTDSTIDAEGSPTAVRNIGHATKMGMDKMTPDVAQRINYYEAKMMRTPTASARRKVVHEFEEEIKRNMGAEKWAKYKEYEGSILHARASTWLAITRPEEKGAFTDPKKRAYGKDSVPPARKELETNRKHLEALKKSAEERGDIEKAAHYQDALEAADGAFARYTTACQDYVNLSKKKKLTPAERKKLNNANQVLNDMGTEQPVWAHQRTNRINFSINPRVLAWYQAGRAWRSYEKFDTLFMEKPVRLWKQWAMFGFGFPLRVYAGDEFWRIPMEGISLKQARQSLAMTKRLRGQLSRKERRIFNKLDEQSFKDLTDAEKTQLRELEKKMTPELSEYELRSLNDREDFDWANDPSDSFEIISPRRVEYTDADGNVSVRHEIPDEPLYLPAIKHVIQKLGDNPTIHELFKETPPEGGWTIGTVKETLLRIAGENSNRGRVIRQFLYDTDRITLKQMGEEGLSPKAFKDAVKSESAGAYRNVDNVFGEWADVFVKLSRNDELLEGVKNRHISIRTLSRINAEDLFPVPIKRRILTSNGMPDVPILNLPSKIYNGVKLPGTEFDVGTLPMLTYIGTKVRDILWGTEYQKQLDIELKSLSRTHPEYNSMSIVERRHLDNEASKRAAQRAAHFVDKTTYVRDATVFEDMVRDALPFINSYRQFMVYWGSKMVTRPFTMGAIWSLTPELPTDSEWGPFKMFLSSFAPFFLQPNFEDEDGRDKTPGGLAKAIFQEPSLNPFYTAAVGFLIRELTGTKAEISKLPFMGGASNSLAPLGKAGGIAEGLVGTPEMLQVGGPVPIFKDDTSSHAMLLSMVGAGTEVPDGSMGDKPLKESLPFPLNVTQWAHNPNQLIQSAFGLGPVSAKMVDPVASDYLDEKIKYNKLLGEGKEMEAATYLGSTKYLSIMKMIETSSNAEEIMRLKEDYPWAVRLSVGLYDWNTAGDVVFSPDWAKDAKDLDVYRKDLRDEYLQVWGGIPLDTDGRPLAEQAYGGDINRAKAIPKMEKHLKAIEEYAKKVAMEVAGGDKEFAKSLMAEFHKKCDNDQYVDKYTQIPVLPSWYEDALKRDAKDPKLWHPKFYQETVLGLYGNDFQGGNWEPSESETKAVLQMQKEGLLYGSVVQQLFGDFSKWGSVAAERETGLKDSWRKKYLYLAEEEWYDLDAKTLNRIGFNVSKKIDPVLLDVRAAYYKWKAIGDEFGTSSREYREGRNKFYAYKDKKFLAVPGGEIFVGGLPTRLMKTPFIVGAHFTFTGDKAKDNQKLWQMYHAECIKDKPDLAKIRELKTHFNGQLQDKIADWKAQCDWAAVIGTANYMRWVMKTTWSDYYEGYGNSVYTKMGEKMVGSLENMVKEYKDKDYGDEENVFSTDINKYFGTPHELAYKMLEWYSH